MMKTNCGLYVTMGPKNSIKRDLTAMSGEVSLKETTVAEEIITFSELNFFPYAQVLDTIILSSKYLYVEGDKNFGDLNRNVFDFILDTVDDLVVTFEEENPLYGTLTRTILEDSLPENDGTPQYAYFASLKIIEALTDVIQFQLEVNEVLNDLRHQSPPDLKGKYYFLQRMEAQQILCLDDTLTMQYYFRSVSDYYLFLLLHFIASKPNVALCECCGRYFIPKTKKKTLYCDRVLKNGRTCKELAPSLKHKLAAQSKVVIEEFDRAKQRMYKRYERAEDGKQTPSDKDLSYAEYYQWLDRATAARDRYLAGELSEEAALEIIVAP